MTAHVANGLQHFKVWRVRRQKRFSSRHATPAREHYPIPRNRILIFHIRLPSRLGRLPAAQFPRFAKEGWFAGTRRQNSAVRGRISRDFSAAHGRSIDVANIGKHPLENRTMSSATLESILTYHAIPLAYWPEMRALVFDGTRPQQGTICAGCIGSPSIDGRLTQF